MGGGWPCSLYRNLSHSRHWGQRTLASAHLWHLWTTFFDQPQMQILTQAELDLHCTTMAADDSNTDTEKDMEHSILFHAIAELETTTGRVEPSQLKHQTKGLHKSRTKTSKPSCNKFWKCILWEIKSRTKTSKPCCNKLWRCILWEIQHSKCYLNPYYTILVYNTDNHINVC